MSEAKKQLKATITEAKPKVPPANGYGSSAASAVNEGKPRPSQLDMLLDLAHKTLILFPDQNGDGYAFYNGQCVKLKSSKMRKVLSHMVYKCTGKVPNKETLSQAIDTLEGIAIFDRDERRLENRIASHDGKILYDLGDHRAVRITKHGWEIILAPPKFRRYSHQSVQVSPRHGGDVHAIFQFVNVAPKHRLLILVTLISYFIPEIPHPIFHPWGPQGSGKTCLCIVFKRLVDPSIVETLMCSTDRSKIIHGLLSHYMPIFDNLSRLDGETSDILCQACTGGGIEQRQLYTDCDSVIFQILRCVGVNGINLSIIKPDLLDRTLLQHLERIPPEKRREEKELWAAFEVERPYILGGIFDIVSKAISIHPKVKLKKLPRLADFGRWGYAIAEAIEPGLGKQFVADYEQNVQQQVDEAIQSNTLANALLMYMSKRIDNKWESTVNTAFIVLKTFADPDRYDKSFPQAPRELRRHLERLKSTLEERGISYSIGARTADGYPIAFHKLDNFASFTSSSSPATPVNAANELNAAKFTSEYVAALADQM